MTDKEKLLSTRIYWDPKIAGWTLNYMRSSSIKRQIYKTEVG